MFRAFTFLTLFSTLLMLTVACAQTSQEPSTLGQAMQAVGAERGLSPAPTLQMAEQTGSVNEWEIFEHNLLGRVA